MKQIVINKNDAGQRLNKFIEKTFPAIPPSLMYKSIRTKNIKINRKRCTPDQKLWIEPVGVLPGEIVARPVQGRGHEDDEVEPQQIMSDHLQHGHVSFLPCISIQNICPDGNTKKGRPGAAYSRSKAFRQGDQYVLPFVKSAERAVYSR